MVVLGHFKLLSGTGYPSFPFNLADAAVDCFFVVSGFLIAGSYERCHGLWSFYVRRVFRLYPMYLCVVLIQTVIMLALLPGGPFSELRVDAALSGSECCFWRISCNTTSAACLSGLHNPGINPSLWTLKIEIGFYLIVPLIFVATRRWGWLVLVVDLRRLGWLQPSSLCTLATMRLAKQLPGQLQFFVVGMALYLYGERLRVPTLVSCAIAVAFLVAWTFVHRFRLAFARWSWRHLSSALPCARR